MKRLTCLATLTLGLAALLPSTLHAQGITDYVNVESVQCKPIAVARFQNHDYLLVCNTPDNSVEIYDTSETGGQPTLLSRVGVGLEPVSVVYDASTSRFYTANAFGDSISLGRLLDPPGASTFAAQLLKTVNVGDEPTHLVVDSDRDCLWVSLRSRSALTLLDRVTLEPKALAGTVFSNAALNDLVYLTDVGVYVSSQGGTDGAMAVKQPHTILLDEGGEAGRLLVLGYRGGGDPGAANNVFDLDLWGFDFDAETVFTVPGANTALGEGLGTTNFNMAQAANGDVYVVSAEARNDVIGNVDLSGGSPDTVTGFVTTLLHRVSDVDTVNEAVESLDLNSDGSGGAVATDESLAHCTDVVMYEPAVGGPFACVTAFNSDRFAKIDVSAASSANWTIEYLDIADATTDPVRGPRSLAIKYANGAQTNDPGDRIYVLNRLENSITVIDPAAPLPSTPVTPLALSVDPRPAKQTDGQEFLYSTRYSGSGFVSCASCHVDSRTDALGWFVTKDPALETPCGLDSFDHFAPPGPASALAEPTEKFELSFGVSAAVPDSVTNLAIDGFDHNKFRMVTQSLQGLVNYELEDDLFQQLTTNAPYHWRGDKPEFQDFNEAFVNLQDMTNLDAPDTCLPTGLTPGQMDAYTAYVNTIHYPPNPDQPLERIYSGSLGADPDDEDLGSGALRGLKLYHTTPHIQSTLAAQALDITGARSCVQCHSLPEGSNNRITDRLDGAMQPTETAQLKDLVQKEERLVTSPTDFNMGWNMTNNWGFRHNGSAEGTINDFINQGTFKSSAPKLGFDTTSKVEDTVRYVREFDWGMAPIVGQTLTVTSANKALMSTGDRLTLFEEQVKRANAGLSVFLRTGGVERGFWFRLSAGCVYQEVPAATGQQLTRTQLLALIANARDMAVFTATPLGSDRRIASLDGLGDVLTGPAPFGIEFESTTPNTANVDVPTISKNWERAVNDDVLDANRVATWLNDPNDLSFFWLGTFDTDGGSPVVLEAAPHPLSLTVQRIFQQALAADTAPSSPPDPLLDDPNGPTLLHHDAPRRLVVTGSNIREGAKIAVFMNANTLASPVWISMSLNIYPRIRDEGQCGELVWETSVEFEPEEIYMFRAGGPFADDVQSIFDGSIVELPPPSLFAQIASWNQYLVYVQNEDLTQGANMGTPVPFKY